MKTWVLERAKSNLLLLCASFVTVKNMVLNSYVQCIFLPTEYQKSSEMLNISEQIYNITSKVSASNHIHALTHNSYFSSFIQTILSASELHRICLTARGLYHRWGITPRPEDLFTFLNYVNTFQVIIQLLFHFLFSPPREIVVVNS